MKKSIALIICLVILSVSCLGRGIISFTFDDGYKSIVNVVLPLMDRYGFRGTAYVVIDKVGKKGHMDSQDISTLRNHGWEIGSHGCGCENFVVTSWFSMDRIRHELSFSQFLLGASTFSSPHGAYNQSINELIKEYYQAHRTTDLGLNDRTNFDPYGLKSVSPMTCTSLSELKAWVDRAIEEDAWLIFTFHSFDQCLNWVDSLWDYDGEKFGELLDYISKKDIEVRTIIDVISDKK